MIGLVGAGQMGSALGVALRAGGHEVVTSIAGRSARTIELAGSAGLRTLPSLDDVVSAAHIVLVVTPPDEAPSVASDLAGSARRSGSRPLVADLNAISPSTVDDIGAVLSRADLELVDGAISGPPPTVRPGARIYLSGKRANEVAELGWRGVTPIVVAGDAGVASAVKMCTASVHKGLTGILTQAVRTAAHYGVVDHVLADLGQAGHAPVAQIAIAATKAWRFAPEMREIARTQAEAGLPASLFEAMKSVYEELALTPLARGNPESVKMDLTAEDLVSLLN